LPGMRLRKECIIDALCNEDQGTQTLVKIQIAHRKKGFREMFQYDAAEAYVNQMRKIADYKDLKPVIFLAITDFILFPDEPGYKADHALLNTDSFVRELNALSFAFVELPKFDKTREDINALNNRLEKWCYLFNSAEGTKEQDIQEMVGEDSIFEKVYSALNKSNWTDAALIDYENEKNRQLAASKKINQTTHGVE